MSLIKICRRSQVMDETLRLLRVSPRMKVNFPPTLIRRCKFLSSSRRFRALIINSVLPANISLHRLFTVAFFSAPRKTRNKFQYSLIVFLFLGKSQDRHCFPQCARTCFMSFIRPRNLIGRALAVQKKSGSYRNDKRQFPPLFCFMRRDIGYQIGYKIFHEYPRRQDPECVDLNNGRHVPYRP